MSETCDGCPRPAEHHLCDECCHAEPDAINRENEKFRAEVRDLKARLKAARRRFQRGAIAEAYDALDIKNTNWRRKS